MSDLEGVYDVNSERVYLDAYNDKSGALMRLADSQEIDSKDARFGIIISVGFIILGAVASVSNNPDISTLGSLLYVGAAASLLIQFKAYSSMKIKMLKTAKKIID